MEVENIASLYGRMPSLRDVGWESGRFFCAHSPRLGPKISSIYVALYQYVT